MRPLSTRSGTERTKLVCVATYVRTYAPLAPLQPLPRLFVLLALQERQQVGSTEVVVVLDPFALDGREKVGVDEGGLDRHASEAAEGEEGR